MNKKKNIKLSNYNTNILKRNEYNTTKKTQKDESNF